MRKSVGQWLERAGGLVKKVIAVLGCRAAILALPLITACSAPANSSIQPNVVPPDSKRVLLVMNSASTDSQTVGQYYAMRRKIPRQNWVQVNVSTSDNITPDEFRFGIMEPVKKAIKSCPNDIDFIVLTKGIPIRQRDGNGFSVDAWLAAMNLDITPIEKLEEDQIKKSLNPYFNSSEPFSSKKFNMYLVTRIDGYDVEQCKTLIDNAMRAKPDKGPFFFDAADNRKNGGYLEMQQMMYRAKELLSSKGFDAKLDDKAEFVAPNESLMGYTSWGSNDGAYKQSVYRALRFKPGAIAETFVSTSGRTFNKILGEESLKNGGQSLIADLIEAGITGVKGYVSEPYTFALAHPDILFDRYTSGFTLAESFYSASLVAKWKDVVIGDPICRPYPQKGIAESH